MKLSKKQIESLTRIFGRVCDLDKAAQRYKLSFAVGATAWGLRTALVIAGVMHVHADTRDFDPDLSFLTNLQSHPETTAKLILYGTGWVILKALHWGGFAYGSVGLAHAQLHKKPDVPTPG